MNALKKKTHILHMDDDQLILDIYKTIFEEAGYQVTAVKGLGKDFMVQINLLSPSLIISDINNSNFNGMDFLKEIKLNKQTKDIPFIFLSNSINQQNAHEIKDMGVVAFLIKAELRPSEVLAEVNKIINR